MRTIHVNEDLRGVTINNPGPFLYVGNCIQGEKDGKLTTFTGDCTAADFINNDGPADWSQADLYAGQWRGNISMKGSKWPTSIGYLHHEPVGTIINEAAAAFPKALGDILRGVGAFVLADMVGASWYSSPSLWWDGATEKQREERVAAWRQVFAPYRSLAGQFEKLLRDLQDGAVSFKPLALSRDAEFADGVKITVDAMNLPALPRPLDRYELARKIKADADALSAEAHHVFLYSIVPPVPVVMRGPEGWLQRKAGL